MKGALKVVGAVAGLNSCLQVLEVRRGIGGGRDIVLSSTDRLLGRWYDTEDYSSNVVSAWRQKEGLKDTLKKR